MYNNINESEKHNIKLKKKSQGKLVFVEYFRFNPSYISVRLVGWYLKASCLLGTMLV